MWGARPILLLLLLAAVGYAQAQERPGESVKLEFQNTEIGEVISTISELTGRNFLYDEDEVRGRVTVVSPVPVTIEEALRVFESILHVRGLTTVPAPGGALKIVQIGKAARSPIPTLPADIALSDRDRFITRLLPLRHVKVDALSNALKPLISGEASLIAYRPTNTLILTDAAANVRRLGAIVGQVDIETHHEQIEVLNVQYADASALAEKLEEIFAERVTQTTARARASARTRRSTSDAEPRVAEGETAVAAEISGRARFVADERTNSIIVIATPATFRQIERFVPLLDYAPKGSGRIHVYRLHNADAEEMAETLNHLATASGGGTRPPSVGAAALAELGSDVRITADAPTNSLIIQASAKDYGALSEVIVTLDARRPQVVVEALIVELDVTSREEFGLAWLIQNELGDGFFSVGTDPAGVLPEPAGPVVPVATGAGLIGSTVENLTTSILAESLFVPGIGNIPVIQAILTAARDDTNADVLSAPVILTVDNEEVEIVIGTEIPVLTTRLQAADPSGGFQTSQDIARYDVGVTLRLTAQIGAEDTIRLDIFQEISEVKETDPELGPTTTNRQLEGTVYVPDGHAVVLGGIVSEVRTQRVDKVPFLGDIPILGWAFKTTSDVVRKINLLVILTPHIVREPEDLSRLSEERRELFREGAGGLRALGADADGTGAGPYLVQAAFFFDPGEATALLETLIERGYEGTVLSRTEGGQAVHFVQLGPYATQDAAWRVAREVQREADLRPLLVVEPVE